MLVGVPTEIKDHEFRVALTPANAREYVARGNRVLVQAGAGTGSGFSDGEYVASGAEIAPDAATVFATAEMILKVKEPVAAEYDLLRPGQLLFTYLHLAADRALTEALMRNRVRAVAYETVQLPSGNLPLLTPMSEVAGRMSVQVGAYHLEKAHGGRGLLLGGIPGVPPANVVVVGGGVVGTNAAEIALGMGANVTIVDLSLDRLRYLDSVLHGRLHTLASNQDNLAQAVRDADLVIGAVLLPGAKAPKLVTEPMVASMRPGSVVVDVAIDQGGCIETARPTTHSEPTFVKHGVVHYCVTNMPGAVPRTSTIGLGNATLPFGLQLADLGLPAAALANDSLARGVNVYDGEVTYGGVAEALGLPYTPLAQAMAT
ncbi:MAG: alanine dehydrogenase [Thermomicrobiales bacterium]|nr:alanine dehydrogenase [Thermomicrobiales bacterium]